MRDFFRRRPRPLPSRDAYALWAASYPAHAHNPLMALEEEAVCALLPDLRGAAVLDLACGTGRYSRIAQERGAARVVGADDSPAMLHANRAAPATLASMEALPFGAGCFDGVLCGLAVGHLPRLGPALREIARVLQPGGWALISDLHPFAALKGAQRTFTTASGTTCAVVHHVHLYSDYHRAATAAGLIIDATAEPALAQAGTGPAVLALRLRSVAPSLRAQEE